MPESIATARARIRAREITSLELVDASLDAIARDAGRTNAYTRVHAEAARAAARIADDELRAGRDRGPLHGIPISLKDLIDEAGVPNTAGSKALDDRIPVEDAPLVTRLRKAGAIMLGRTNLHEFALGTTSEESGFGPVRHHLDESRVAGGSSGGSAVAVATGMGFASIGTDTGGSIRIPAAACGVVGLKAAYGEVPTAGIVPMSRTFDHAGPLALTVQDAAWIWQILAARPPATIVPAAPERLRLRRLTGYFDAPLAPAVRAAFRAALARLTAEGVVVDSGEVAESASISQTYVNVALPDAAHWHAPYLDTRKARYSPGVHARISAGRDVPAVAYLAALDTRVRLTHHVSLLLQTCDALVLPTLPITAPRIGESEIEVEPSSGRLPVRGVMLKHTQLFNMTGHPAITLPIASDSLPVGLQLVGPLGETDRLLSVAAACESILSNSPA